MINRWKCKECDWIGYDYLIAPNPFDSEYNVTGCPNCKEVNSLVGACHDVNCNREGTCGNNTPDGYVWSCYDHQPAHT